LFLIVIKFKLINKLINNIFLKIDRDQIITMKSDEIIHEQHMNVNSRKTRDNVRRILREKFRK
jgi:hypothetical protein